MGPANQDSATIDDRRLELETDLKRQLAAVYQAHPWLCTSQMEIGAARLSRQVLLASGWSMDENPVGDDGHADGSAPEDYDAPGQAEEPAVEIDHVLGLGVTRGIGDIDQLMPVLGLGQSMTGDIMTDIRGIGGNLSNLPDEIQAKIDAWDPNRRAKVIVPFTVVEGVVAGRPTFGARPMAWERLEDKLAIVEVWEAAGLRQAPTLAIDITDGDQAVAAHRRLASSRGTIVAVDNEKGWHGGATGTHWVQDESEMVNLVERLTGHKRARVMPFLDGVPCSIHGMVLHDRTVAFRPCEMMVFLDEEAGRLHYGQVATFWDPDSAVRAEMGRAAVRLGEELRRRVDFRGVFTLDGVLGEDGFLPTEVNPRYGAALPAQLAAADGSVINLYLINLAVVEDCMSADADALEHWVTARIDEKPIGRSMAATGRAPDTKSGRKGRVESHGQKLRVVDAGQENDGATDGHEPWLRLADAEWGPEGEGGRIMLTLTEHVPVGPPTAPLVARMLRALDLEWTMGLPPLVAAAP